MLREKVLDVLFGEEITQKELTSRLKSSRSRISEVLKQLEREKLINRKRVSERTVLVSLNHSRTLRVGIVRSSEYVHVVSALYELKERVPFRLKVYDNSLEALRDLVTGYQDIVASPMVSGYFFHLIDNNIKPIAGVAMGGAGLIKRSERGKIGTTPLSRMDKDSREYKNYERTYYKSIEDILHAYRKREIDAAEIWEPFLSMNKGIGKSPSGMCCCLFTQVNDRKSIDSFLENYLKSIEAGLPRTKRKWIANILGDLIGVREKAIDSSFDSYIFTASISRVDVENQIASFGLPKVKGVENFLERCSKVSL